MKRTALILVPLMLGLAMPSPARADDRFQRAAVVRAAHKMAQAAEAFHHAIEHAEGFTRLAARVHKLSDAAEHFHKSVEKGASHGHAYRDFIKLRGNYLIVRQEFHRTLRVPRDERNDGWYYKAMQSYSAFLGSYLRLKQVLPAPAVKVGLVVSGRVGHQRFRLSGHTPAEIAKQFSRFFDSRLSGNHWIDEIRVSVNGGREQRFTNQYSYWTRKSEVLRIVMSVVPRAERKPRTWVFMTKDAPHKIGRREGNGWAALQGKDRAGLLAYGPYSTGIPEGRRVASWKVMIDVNRGRNDLILTLDIHDATTGRILARRQLRRSDFKVQQRYQIFGLGFAAHRGMKLEFRTEWHGRGSVRQESVTVR